MHCMCERPYPLSAMLLVLGLRLVVRQLRTANARYKRRLAAAAKEAEEVDDVTEQDPLLRAV